MTALTPEELDTATGPDCPNVAEQVGSLAVAVAVLAVLAAPFVLAFWPVLR